MSYTKWELYYTPFEDNTWNTDKRELLPDFRDIQVRMTLGEGKDSFQFKVVNNYGKYDSYFNPKDKIEIYRAVSTDTVGTDPLMIGSINSNPIDIGYASNLYNVKGNNFSENLLTAVAFFDTAGKTIPEAIQLALDAINGMNDTFKVEWETTNPTKQKDGSDFPTVEEQWYWKPIRKFIEDYSSNVKTEDGNYYYYVNNQNKLVWKADTGFGTDTLDDDVDGYRSITTKKDLSGIRNLIVCQGGLDPAGKQIQVPYFNHTSIAAVGIKFHVLISKNNVGSVLSDQDKSDNNQASKFPDEIEAGTSFTTKWKAQFDYTTKEYGIVVTSGAYTTINEGSAAANKKAYIELIRTETRNRLLAEAEIFAENRQFGTFMMDIEFSPGTKSWGLGDVITVSVDQFKDGEATPLRVKEIQFTTNSDIYTLEEDTGTVGE